MTAFRTARPAEALADEHERAGDPEDRVQRHRDQRDQDREPEGVDRVGVRERVQTGPMPSSNVRKKISPIGKIRSSAR